MGDTIDTPATDSPRDWARQPLAMLLWWGLPLAIGVFTAILHLPLRIAAAVWAASFVWMASGCLVNAWRCHRLHCYISGPVFLLGAVVTGLLASGLTDFGPHALQNAVSATFLLALLSFVPELVWKRHP